MNAVRSLPNHGPPFTESNAVMQPESLSLLDGRVSVQLLPKTAYSTSDPVVTHALGIALERQRGVHAIDSDRRTDFDTWPGVLAYTPPGIGVFSESASGGEYLVVRWNDGFVPAAPAGQPCRVEHAGQGRALELARQLRRLLLNPAPDLFAIEEAVLQFVALRAPQPVEVSSALRLSYARVLDRITAEFDQPLTLTQLAAAEGKAPLPFLREFSHLVGMTPHAFIIETRLQAARRMIEQSDIPLSHIAFDCGFAHQSHMGSAFRKLLAMTPSKYRTTFSRVG